MADPEEAAAPEETHAEEAGAGAEEAGAGAEEEEAAAEEAEAQPEDDEEAAEAKRAEAAEAAAEREKEKKQRKEEAKIARAKAEAEAQAKREAVMREKRAEDLVKHQEEVEKAGREKGQHEAEATEGYEQGMELVKAVRASILKDEEEQRLMDSIYESITDKAVAKVKEHFREYGIELVETERFGLGRVGIHGVDSLPYNRLVQVIQALHPGLNDIRELPQDLLTCTHDEMYHYYQDAWCAPTPGATPHGTPRTAMSPALELWQQQQRANLELGSNVALDEEGQDAFRAAIASKLHMCPEQFKVIVEMITPRSYR
eukprot:TRINITY_DN7753_c0_g1_i2.p2 TRINITY_DN7753_c0_g1~~TRINITY_DN7753_c0_g1_i2.p2  ORF type:complete len:315 (-),score=121.05 TRINITY_DN7753_c0_g1_i2:214-1158(-)